MKLTYELLTALFNNNAPNSPQTKLLGLKYPLQHGWFKKLLDTEI